MNAVLKTRYDLLVTRGEVRRDMAQIAALERLEVLRRYLESTPRRPRGLLRSLLRKSPAVCPPGLYLWGGVGVGKSMLMDLFFATVDIGLKRRVHFHAFMQEIHDAMQHARQSGVSDPLASVAAGVAARARLLCFDEMQISDIADAMLVGRLFQVLLGAGVSIVTTSNRAPDDLYKDGLNRQLFLPFIALLKARLEVHHLPGELDYRQADYDGQQTYFTPNDAAARAALDCRWQALTDNSHAPLSLRVKGRDVVLPRFSKGVARAGFADLCEAPLGAADYLAIAGRVRVLLLDDIPVLTAADNNVAKRFVTLIDALYEARVRFLCSAAAQPEALYQTGKGAFEFHRTASRLREMQGADWGQEPT